MTYPVMLEGARFSALVVGGGAVAARKVRQLLAGGVRVTVVARVVGAELREIAAIELGQADATEHRSIGTEPHGTATDHHGSAPERRGAAGVAPRLTVHERDYVPSDVDLAQIVVAATDDAATNQRVAADASARLRLVNVVDAPDAGNFVTPAVHRSGDLLIAVSTGRAPAAAAAIRTELARRFDDRYASAIRGLRELRDRLLGAGRREDWTRASNELIGDGFCDDVERDAVAVKVASWR